MDLTDTQHAILHFLAERIEAEGMPPTQTEIARAFGFKSLRAAQYHLEALEAAGAIERLPGRARAIRVLQTPTPQGDSHRALTAASEGLLLPVLGNVAAGLPIGSGATENGDAERHLLIDASLFRPSPDYLLRVRGDSMRDEGILEGDLIGVRRAQEAHHGQIVIARIDGEITVKQLSLRGERLRLLPRNAWHDPIEVNPDQDFAIEGIYCGLLRPQT